ncbi:MAG: tripartite tricarboxylate transporter substrate binding protein [Burkholderiales bacterium]|nr:tripartite tricarboxylate transporter substrate binding protein [Burkholderiales bacterium]
MLDGHVSRRTPRPGRRLPAVCALALAPALLAAAGAAGAQSAAAYPAKSIRLVVPSAPGGGTDIIARLIAQGLTDAWGQQVVVDNRGGAGGMAGVTIVAKQSAADGYTMLLGSVGHISFVPAVRANPGFDPRQDLTPISLAAVQPFVLAASNALPVKSVKDLVALAKAKPGTITYGSGGSGAASHLGVELMMLGGGFRMLHVPYKGSNPAITALMSGELNVAMAGLATVLPHARAGRLKALAVTSEKRTHSAPDVPTIAEAGVPGYKFDVWYGLAFPGATPAPLVKKTNAEVVRQVQSPEVAARFAKVGVEPRTNTPEAFAKLVREEIVTWTRVAKAAGIKPE